MPGKLKVKILAGRNLPVMDRSGDTTDAYVELKFNNITYKTDVCRKSLNPQWNSEWYKFEVDDAELQDEPLQIRLMDHDTYSANDAIGKVYLNLNPLLLPAIPNHTKNMSNVENSLGNVPAQGGSVMMGWIPVYDTMHGIRGEVNIIVKVELFIDFNKFKQSSCGVQFFYSPNIPHGYHAQVIHGFVEELIVTDDPEYKWIDKIRTPRASNEARQTLFFKLSGEVQRKIGLKALDLGGNAVVGYQQNFDLEGEYGIVARGIGTAVTLVKLHDYSFPVDGLLTDEISMLYSQSKILNDNSDVESTSAPLISRSPKLSPAHSPLPRMSDRLAFYQRSMMKHSRKTAVRVTDHRANPINRQLSLQSFSSVQMNRSGDSSPSLSDYALDDSSLFEFEQTSKRRFFSRGFRNRIKQFPQVILYKGRKGTKASDEESDIDSLSFSMTSDSARSSVADLKATLKHKKSVGKKPSGDIMAASLIKSLHMGLLDSVKEDRETPTPSPIKFLGDSDEVVPMSKSSSETVIEMNTLELPIPMISSSETDTSTEDEDDDDDDNDEPSESSTNYNILDDSASFQEGELRMDDNDEAKVCLLDREGSESREEEMIIRSDFEDELINFTITKENKDESNQKENEQPDTSLVEQEIIKTEDNLLAAVSVKRSIRSKSPRKVERTNTVIYKGPSKNDLTQPEKDEMSVSVPAISIVVDPPPGDASISNPDDPNQIKMKEALLAKRLARRFRRQCMYDLMSIIDSQMMTSSQESINNVTANETPVPKKDAEPLAEEIINDLIREIAVEKLAQKSESIDKEVVESQMALKELPHSLTYSDRIECVDPINVTNMTDNVCESHSPTSLRQPEEIASSARSSPPPLQATPSGFKHVRSASVRAGPVVQMHRRSSDSDLSITTKGSSLTNSDKSTTNLKPTTPLVKILTADVKPTTAIIRTMHQEAIEMLEYPFMTMLQYPVGFILHIGGFVSARSVKLLERVNSLEEPEGRDFWWTEIRMEVRSHARSLGCNVVIGYREDISICDDICVLSASGTAAVINMNKSQDADTSRTNQSLTGTSVDSDRERPRTYSKSEKTDDSAPTRTARARTKSDSNDREESLNTPSCSICHLPYTENGVPFQMTTSKCAICRRGKVADVMFATTELPENIPVTGRGSFIQATVCKNKRDLRGELNAKEISDLLPFLEYELHSLLYNKLRVKGMNAVFGLKTQISIGEKLMVAMAVGTAVYMTALPEPSVPHIASGNSWHDEDKLTELRRSLAETARKNREFYQLKSLSTDTDNTKSSDTEESEEDLPELDVAFGSKDVCVLEVDDVEDMERINMLIDDRPPDGFHIVNTQTIPGLDDLEIVRNLQMFMQVSRTKVPGQPNPAGQQITAPSKYFESVLQTVYFKLRRMIPCALCGLHFKVALPEQDDMQLSIIGMALGLGEPTKLDQVAEKSGSTNKDHIKRSDDSDMIFSLEEDPAEDSTSQEVPNANSSMTSTSLVATLLHRTRPRSPMRMKSHGFSRPKHVPIKERYGVDITPLSYLPSGKIERYLGNLNFFFIREGTSIRENGGLSGFTHSFMTEILAIVRAHITALGGNAMVSFFMTQCVLLHSPHKNQGQCLINVGGDVVSVSYFGNDRQQHASNC